MKKWFVVLFTSKNKDEVFKVLQLQTIKQVSYLLNEEPQVVSNYFHKLIKARGNLVYCDILQSFG